MDVRTEILRVATELFAARGFDGTSLQHIADRVGVRKQSLLYHFPSKETLRQGVLEQLLQHWNDVLPRLLRVAAAGESQFDGVIRETVRFFTADPDRARLLVREMLDRPEDMKRRLSHYVQPWVVMVADLIRKGQRHGQIYREVDPEAYVLQVIALVVAGVATARRLAGAVLPANAAEGDPCERHLRELVRIAHFSLFCAPHQQAGRVTQPAEPQQTTAEPDGGAEPAEAPVPSGRSAENG